MNQHFATNDRPSAVTHAAEKYAGELAASAWLAARGLRSAASGWDVAIALDVVDRAALPCATSQADSRFHVAISATEWGFYFCHRGRASWIRVIDVPFINELDDHALLHQVPPLRDLGWLVQTVEKRNSIRFRRQHASVRTNLAGAEPEIRSWIAARL